MSDTPGSAEPTLSDTPVDPLDGPRDRDASIDPGRRADDAQPADAWLDRPELVDPDEPGEVDDSIKVGDLVTTADGRVAQVLAVHEDPGEQLGPDGRPLDPQPDPPVMVGYLDADQSWQAADQFQKFDAPTGREEGESK